MKQEMMEWQRYQLDHMQIICTLLQTDNHTGTSLSELCYYYNNHFTHPLDFVRDYPGEPVPER